MVLVVGGRWQVSAPAGPPLVPSGQVPCSQANHPGGCGGCRGGSLAGRGSGRASPRPLTTSVVFHGEKRSTGWRTTSAAGPAAQDPFFSIRLSTWSLSWGVVGRSRLRPVLPSSPQDKCHVLRRITPGGAAVVVGGRWQVAAPAGLPLVPSRQASYSTAKKRQVDGRRPQQAPQCGLVF